MSHIVWAAKIIYAIKIPLPARLAVLTATIRQQMIYAVSVHQDV